jgi:hypothetical protein
MIVMLVTECMEYSIVEDPWGCKIDKCNGVVLISVLDLVLAATPSTNEKELVIRVITARNVW